MKIFITFFLLNIIGTATKNVESYINTNQPNKDIMLKKVNELRAKGCYCGRKYMEPTTPLVWENLLEKSAMNHAIEMYKYNFFAHYSRDGKDIGQRLDALGYKWRYVGENIGEGQENFDEVLNDWIASKSHCRMLMNPDMQEMGIARHKNFWVQHFGTKLVPR